ncbi:MAG TPA: hypothetical protein VMT46_09570, partial [Anaerolineaceae bacterium]|nr:hypothetical protein [Anaerolineaceae bacterium]
MKRSFTFFSLMIIMAMLLAACAPAATPAPTEAMPAPTQAPAPTEAMPAPTEAMPAPTEAMPAPTQPAASTGAMDYSKVGKELADAFTGAYKGKTVTMAGPFTDQDAV